MSLSEKYIEEGEKNLLHTYNRFPIVLDHGEGVYLTDVDGKKYLDFASGIAVFALGYNDPEYNDALKKQIDKIIHTSNLYYNVPAVEAAKELCAVSGMDRVFFTNSGTEAIEGAIKSALKYAYTKAPADDYEIIAMEHSFHGRSMGALSVTGNAHYREAFGEGIGHIEFAEYNDLESVKAKINSKTCAIIMETVQGEGGIYPASEEFLKGVRKICDENDILLILDEIQCGMGRTGSMFAFEDYGIKPDILTTAKALGCGVPVGAFLMTERVAEKSLVPGDHGSTYGGNPFACAAVLEVLRQYKEKDIVGHVKEITPYLEAKLDELKEKFPNIIDRRGKGFMQALEFDGPVGEIVTKAQEKGALIITAGTNVLRLVPPLIIEKEHVDSIVSILTEILQKY
ncbi:acetylornithine/N-succinyldiaminopimelate aminotransferase [Lachnospiraceae bacterium]|nr:acetylornithine/N-succinyldiaminopimelate aminotransferase [Lachnospiraceae bacterium]